MDSTVVVIDDFPASLLAAAFVISILVSAFFAAAETSMMAANRYRLRHLAAQGDRAAARAAELLERPDRLIGLILLGQNFANAMVTSLCTILAVRRFGEAGLAIAPVVSATLLLMFGEALPKTLAALRPEAIALPSAFVLKPTLRLLYPVVWAANALVNLMLRTMRIRVDEFEEMPLSREELRTIVKEAGAMIPRKHQQMLFGILDLEKITVEDIMVPRADVTGLDLDTGATDLEDALVNCRHTRLPVYRGSIDHVIGILHVRRALALIKSDRLTTAEVEAILSEPYYVPSGTPLHTQLFNFQRLRRRIGLVVNEYGDIIGLVTLEDLLEEIVGEFTTDTQVFSRDIHAQDDGSFLIDGGASIRDINRQTHWQLPADGPRTLNGLILETLENIPEPGVSLRIGSYVAEIVQTAGQSVKTARLWHAPPSTSEPHPPA
ncbi:MAG: HlyC/CorC family transporter [Gammaproteobacteria bacterium]